MSSKEEWDKYQEALLHGDNKAAAEAFQRYLDAKKAEGKPSSSPTLVNLSSRAVTYPNAIPLEQIPDELTKNPEFFDLMKRIAEKEK